MPECPPTPFVLHVGEPRLQGAGPPPGSSGAETAAGRRRTPSGHMCHHQHPASGEPPKLQPSLIQPPHQTPAPSLRDPEPWWPVSTPMWPPARAAGPLGPARPQASSLAGRRVEGSGSQQPEVCARAYISHQLFLPRAARKPGGPGLPLPRLVKPAQQHPRPGGALVPGCHQRLPPATEAQRCPNSLPSGC